MPFNNKILLPVLIPTVSAPPTLTLYLWSIPVNCSEISSKIWLVV